MHNAFEFQPTRLVLNKKMLKKGTLRELNIQFSISDILSNKRTNESGSNEIQSMVQQMDNRWRGAVNHRWR